MVEEARWRLLSVTLLARTFIPKNPPVSFSWIRQWIIFARRCSRLSRRKVSFRLILSVHRLNDSVRPTSGTSSELWSRTRSLSFSENERLEALYCQGEPNERLTSQR